MAHPRQRLLRGRLRISIRARDRRPARPADRALRWSHAVRAESRVLRVLRGVRHGARWLLRGCAGDARGGEPAGRGGGTPAHGGRPGRLSRGRVVRRHAGQPRHAGVVFRVRPCARRRGGTGGVGDRRAAAGDGSPLTPRAAVLAAVAMLVASQSFGTGAAVALVFPIVAVLLRPATLRAPLSRAIVAAVPLLVLGVWLLMTGTADAPQSRRRRVDQGDGAARHRLSPYRLDERAPAGGRAGLAAPGVAVHARGLREGAVRSDDRARRPRGGRRSSAFGDGRVRRALLACLVAAVTCYLAISAGRASFYVSSPGTTSCRRWSSRRATSTLRRACWRWRRGDARRDRPPAPSRARRMGAGVVGLWTVWAMASLFYFPPGRLCSVSASGSTCTDALAAGGGHPGRRARERRSACRSNRRRSPLDTRVCSVSSCSITRLTTSRAGASASCRRIPRCLPSARPSARLRALIVPEGACPPSGAKPG